MRINKIRWRNFTSWGNAWNELVFSPKSGLNLICGENGAGKTSIANFIIYMMYGQLDDFTQGDIPNRVNKHFEGEIDLDCDGRHVFIHRGLAPNMFDVSVDGERIDTAGKSNVQKYLDDEVFKMQYQIFKNSIILSVDVFKSFVKLTPSEKRDILDRIFGYTAINSASAKVKEKIKGLKSSLSDIGSEIDGYETSIKSITEKIDDLENSKADTSESESELSSLNTLLTEKAKAYKETCKSLETFGEELSSCDKELSNISSRISEIRKKLKLYSLGKCPTCGSDLNDDTHKNEAASLNDELSELLKSESVKTEHRNGVYGKCKDTETMKRDYINEITNLKVRKGALEAKISADKNRNDEVASDMRKLISEIEEKKRPKLVEAKGLSAKLRLLDIVSDIFSDKGLKRYISDMYVPYINSSIIDICERVGINYRIVFDNNYDCTLYQLGEVVKYKTLSRGEKKKVDIAVTLAFLHIIKTKISDINVLFLDEVLSGIDVSSCNELLKIFNSFSQDNSIDMYIVHHAVLDSTYVDKTIEIEKNNGFSHFVE